MFFVLVWFLLIGGTAFWMGSFPGGWDFNSDGVVTIRDLWTLAGGVAVMPVVGMALAIIYVFPERILNFFEFGHVAEWLIKGSLSGVIGVASWLLVLVLLARIEFRIMQWVSPQGWEHLWRSKDEKLRDPSRPRRKFIGLDVTEYRFLKLAYLMVIGLATVTAIVLHLAQ